MANKEYIGKNLFVKIDREFGSKHPKHGFIYPVNYGFVLENKEYSDDAIEALVEFQERFFEHIIVR